MRCYGATVYKCSVCGDVVDEMPTVMGVPKYRYCPSCGAKMKIVWVVKGADNDG
jgi:rubredoxin